MDAPYLLTAYSTVGEAWRSDRFEGFVPQPDPGGVMLISYGVENYVNITPVSDNATSSADSGNGAMIGGVVAGAAALGLVGVLLLRRRSHASADDRE
jgi:peptide/nickel transport system substrate-binding protein